MRMRVQSLASLSGGSSIVSCGVHLRCGSDAALLWLWYRPAATAPYVVGVALKSKKKKKDIHQRKTKVFALSIYDR